MKLKLFTIATALLLKSQFALAHSGSATMDESGEVATFTGLARVTCFDDGNGTPDSLIARIRDNSAPVDGLLVNVQLLKGTRAISISDTVSGDAEFSDYIQLVGGQGTYYLILNKTAAGARNIELEYHCLAADSSHTGTDIIANQWE